VGLILQEELGAQRGEATKGIKEHLIEAWKQHGNTPYGVSPEEYSQSEDMGLEKVRIQSIA